MTDAVQRFADGLTVEQLREAESRADRAGDSALRRVCADALALKRRDSGALIEIVEAPGPQNGWRNGVTRFEGDVGVFLEPFVQKTVHVLKIDSNAGRGPNSPLAQANAAKQAAVLQAARERGEL